ncbi:GNAT family N-acetyltransferase [Streptomyces sp. NPDC097619]|uniref:GNAT family N-acetyltransferase n=1 Tax=Streptomyces sp. NPDC097619 TaxID=3157228 RepID=UPI00332F1B52
MAWTFSEDVEQYQDAAGAFVAGRPVSHTLLLTVADAVLRRGPLAFGDARPVFGWWRGPDGAVAGALLRTPPYPLVLGVLPEAAVAELAEVFAAEPSLASVVEVSGRREEVLALAAARGGPSRVVRELRLHRLGELVPPVPFPAGRARPAGSADLPLVREWFAAFDAETEQPAPAREAAVRDRLGYGGLVLWEDAGLPVSMAGFTRPVGGVARVGPVYTPPERRGRGFAAAVAASASEAAWSVGAREVVLFTGPGDPVGGGVYRRIGYEPVEDRVVVAPG